MRNGALYREYAIRAFMFWAREGCPSVEEYLARFEGVKSDEMTASEHIGEIQDIMACCDTFRILTESGRKDACEAVKVVYMADSGRVPGRKEVTRRVIAYSLDKPVAERTVYYWLRTALRTFAECRALRIE